MAFSTLDDIWAETKAKSQELYQEYAPEQDIEIGVAYGTEKRKWFEWAVKEFAGTEVGRGVKVKLIPMGSIEGARAVLGGDRRIHVWSPASSLVEGLLNGPWEREHDNSPILSDAPLALTPMVVVMWQDRYELFAAKYKEVNYVEERSTGTHRRSMGSCAPGIARIYCSVSIGRLVVACRWSSITVSRMGRFTAGVGLRTTQQRRGTEIDITMLV
jgi:hypothetical protein